MARRRRILALAALALAALVCVPGAGVAGAKSLGRALAAPPVHAGKPARASPSEAAQLSPAPRCAAQGRRLSPAR